MTIKKGILCVLSLSLLIIIMVACNTIEQQSNVDESFPDNSRETDDSNPPVLESEATSIVDLETAETLNPLTALEVQHLMGNGINLGNTMEAYGHESLGINADISSYESFWGQPVTTQEMITEMKNSGFDSLRIPVAWTNTMDYENGDYTIATEYLDRVEDIVNYALNEDMYVMINDHWDGGWWGMFGSADVQTRQKAMTLYTSMWSQIAERFKDYSHKVIFESANEELGNRLNDADVAADSGSLSEDECYETTNTINQTFVNLIRESGGNNINRFLLIAGYNTDIEKTMDNRFIMPRDMVDNKLLLSVHYYTPWSYCGTESVASWGTEQHYIRQNELLQKLTKFTDQGYGIVLGEYAVLTKKDNSIKNNTIDFTKNFLDNCDIFGYVPMLWDTSSFFIREDLKIQDEGLATLYKERSFSHQSQFSLEDVIINAKTSIEASLVMAIENDRHAPELLPIGDEDAIAWIMFNSNDYNVTYSVGDTYDPSLKTDGVQATDVYIETAGTYTIALDFTQTSQGYANSTSFSAIGISNGELLYPGYLITLEEVLINGEAYELKGIPYTTSDDQITTRVNLYNGWVSEIPEEARIKNPQMANFLTATPLTPNELPEIKTLSVTFTYEPID